MEYFIMKFLSFIIIIKFYWCCYIIKVASSSFPASSSTSSLSLSLGDDVEAVQQIQCNSITIQTIENYYDLQKCQIIVGHLTFIDIHFNETILNILTPTNITEITDYLLVHRVTGLDTLERLLPVLTIIRGIDLLFDRYALILYENRNLENIGLISLLRIYHGSIRIETNPSLCYVNTINWMAILTNDTQNHFIIKKNKSPNYCPLCGIIDPNNTWSQHCWSFNKYQKYLTKNLINKCWNNCVKRNAIINKKNCITKCDSNNIPNRNLLCNGFIQDNQCVDSCNETYVKLSKRECISINSCRNLSKIPFDRACRDECPYNYQKYSDEQTPPTCKINCTGNFRINTQDDLNGLDDCAVIEGSLTIELLDIKSPIIPALEKAFANLLEISDYLKIVHNPQLVSLNFFNKLQTIGGKRLINNRYALYVVNNYYLEELWCRNQQVAILNGHIYFHLNARLCYEKIIQIFNKQLRNVSTISIKDISRNSNGERVICSGNIHQLNTTIEAVNSNSVRIKVNPMSSQDKDLLYGYVYYYKISPNENVTMYDGRHGCGYDNWHMDYSSGLNIRHVLTNLKPFTKYAYFVRALTSLDFHYQLDALSDIHYFQTESSIPDPPARIFYRSYSASELEIHWWPPRNPNGIITNYTIYVEDITNEILANLTLKKYLTKATSSIIKSSGNCLCPNYMNSESGPWPNQDDYYNKEQLVYDETIQNLIYVSTKMNERKMDNKLQKLNGTEKSTEQAFIKLHEFLEKKALAEQDTGPNSFPLITEKSPCKTHNDLSFTKQDEEYKERNMKFCKSLKFYDATTTLSGQTHFYILRNLIPEKTYRIYLRACIQNLQNCGPAITLIAETISKPLENFLHTIKQY